MADFTVNDVILRARRVLNDVQADGYVWQDAELIQWTDDAQRELYGLRPDAVLWADDSSVSISEPDTLTAKTDNLGVADRFLNTLVDYVLARAFEKEHMTNHQWAARSAMYQSRFTRAVTGQR